LTSIIITRNHQFFKCPQNSDNTSAIEEAEQGEFSYTALEMQTSGTTLQNYFTVSYKAKNMFNHDLAMSLLDIYPSEMKTYVYKKACT
jgi:hypothetical protein